MANYPASLTSAAGGGYLGNLFVRFTADATQYASTMSSVGSITSFTATQVVAQVTKMATAVTAAFAAMGVVSLNEFRKWDTSFTGMRKTIDASEADIAKLGAAFRQLARELPYNVNELNKVAAAAGQLGVKKDVIFGFTKTMLDLAETTDLTAENASFSLALFANITQMPQAQFDRLANTLARLDLDTAATASGIMEMAMRIAGAGTTLGMAEHQILGIAAALSSVGVYAERGGTAMAETMEMMDKAMFKGGDSFRTFAKVAGVTADQFIEMYAHDSVDAIAAFLDGLQRIKKSGGDVFGTLEKLNIDGVRMQDVLQRASNSGKLFSETLKKASDAWKDNNAISDSTRKYYATFNNQMQILIGNFREIAIQIGSKLAPILLGFNNWIRAHIKDSENWGDTLAKIINNIIIPVFLRLVGAIGDRLQLLKTLIYGHLTVWTEFAGKVVDTIKNILGMVEPLQKLINGVIAFRNASLPLATAIPLVPVIDTKATVQGLDVISKAIEGTKNDAIGKLKEIAKSKPFSQWLLEDYKEFAKQYAIWDSELAKHIKESAAGVNKYKPGSADYQRSQDQTLIENMDIPGFEYKKVGASGEKEIKRYKGYGIAGIESPEFHRGMQINTELEKNKEDLKELEEIYKRRETLDAEHLQKLERLLEAHNRKEKVLWLAQQQIALASFSSTFDSLASIAETWGGKQSAFYKSMFAMSKAFAIAEATVKIMLGIAEAAGQPWPLNIAAMAQVAAATASIVSNIASVTLAFSGQDQTGASATAREMGGPVSPGSMYMVGEKGPELFSPSQNGTIIPNHALKTTVNVHNYSGGTAEVKERNEGGQKVIDVIVRRVKDEIGSEIRDGRGDVSKSMESTFNLRRGRT